MSKSTKPTGMRVTLPAELRGPMSEIAKTAGVSASAIAGAMVQLILTRHRQVSHPPRTREDWQRFVRDNRPLDK